MAFVKDMKVFVVAPKEHKESMDILWNGFDETDHKDLEMWATLEEAKAELAELREQGKEPEIYEVQLSVIRTVE